MDLETMFKETYVSQPTHLQESCLQPSLKDVLLSSYGFFKDFHHIDQFHHVNISSSNTIQTPNFDAFDNFTNTGSSPDFDFMISQRNQLDMMVANQRFLPFNPQEIKPSNFVVPYEVSCTSPVYYYKRVGVNKNNKSYPTTRRTFKVRKKSNIVKGKWTIDDGFTISNSIQPHIAKILPGRIGKQRRERWHNHLRPDIKKDTWTDEEDKVLIEVHDEVGNKWAEIATRLPGRTENSIKNHWNATKRRQHSKRKCRSKYLRGTLLQEYIKSLNLDKNPPRDYRRKCSSNYGSAIMSDDNKISTSKITAPALPQTAFQFCAATDFLAPNYDFRVVPDFFFGENLFEEGCNVDSLLDGVPCAPLMDKKDFEEKLQCDDLTMCVPFVNIDENHIETEMPLEMLEVELKKELDLVEMMSQINNEILHV
ncbi:hypothetical protein GYH30_010358 [Glycine max]|nr:hypothetical protein GYH30_010358 [Glycine max]